MDKPLTLAVGLLGPFPKSCEDAEANAPLPWYGGRPVPRAVMAEEAKSTRSQCRVSQKVLS